MNIKRTAIISGLLLLTVSLSFFSGVLFERYYLPATKFGVLSEAYKLLQEHAFEDLPSTTELEYGMIRGMLSTFDEPYTIFVDPPEHQLQSDDLQGSFGGIGAQVSVDVDGRYLLFPIPQGPADLAGILDGDNLIGVDDFEISPDISMSDVISRVRGPEGELVKIVILRGEKNQEYSFDVERGNIALPSVTFHLAANEARLGVIEINLIASTSVDEIITAIKELQEDGATYFILDLRGNRGGLLEPGIEITNMFLDEGTIITRQYRDEEPKSFFADNDSIFSELPIIVLVDQNTASAAEIIAGALQSNQRAIIVGVQTYGKNSIQLVFELRDGSSLHVTTAKWWFEEVAFPVNGSGLIPDMILADEELQGEFGINAIIGILFDD